MNKLKSLGRQKAPGTLLGAELEELARAATKKTLPGPDEELIQQVRAISCYRPPMQADEASRRQRRFAASTQCQTCV